jgi:lipopolysaccharide export system permease protein
LILFRYIVREILLTLLAVTLILVVIVVSGRLVKYLDSAAAGDLAPDILFSIIFFRLPSFLELIVPLAFFVSVVLALGRLYVDSEITVMSACGLSQRRLLAIALAPALLVALLVAGLSLGLSPYGIDRVQRIFDEADAATGLELLVAGRFRLLNEGNGRVTYVEHLEEGSGDMLGVFAADRTTQHDGSPRQVVVIAERGRTQNEPDSGERFLVLQNGTRYMGQPGELDFQVMDFDTLGQWLQQRHPEPALRKRDAVATAELLRTTDPVLRATLHWRVSLALLVVVSTLIAVAMARTDPRRGRYSKLFPAFLIFMIYLLLLNAAREAMGKQQLPPALGLWWVHGLFALIGVGLMFGGVHWRGWRVRRQLAHAARA